MELETWVLFLGVAATAAGMPGPAMLAIIGVSLAWGPRRALGTIVGNAAAVMAMMGIATLGAGAVAGLSDQAFDALRLAGAAYLIWLGLRGLGRRHDAPEARPAAHGGTLFLQGLAIGFGNPKAILFFVALFPPFINPDASLFPQFAALGATFVTAELLATTVAAVLAARIAGRSSRSSGRIGACILILAGAILLASTWG